MKKYLDTENNTIITESELYNEWCENYSNDERTFAEYINDCTDKNGFLMEV